MGFRPEPVLDVARGLSAFTAAYILGNQVLVVIRELFEDRCAFCRGAGRLICPHCGGTKTLRTRPGEFQMAHMDIVERKPSDVLQCIHCGPLVIYDLVQQAKDDEDGAFDIMDNMKDAYAGRTRRRRMPVLAGTIPCPKCFNEPKVRRHTPNFARIFKLEDPWWWQISNQMGLFRGFSPIRKKNYVEYPSRRPHVDDLDPKHIIDTMEANYDATVEEWEEKNLPKPAWQEDLEHQEMALKPKSPEEEQEEALTKSSGGDAWTGRGQMNELDFVTKYVDDSDSEEDA